MLLETDTEMNLFLIQMRRSILQDTCQYHFEVLARNMCWENDFKELQSLPQQMLWVYRKEDCYWLARIGSLLARMLSSYLINNDVC